ncbi:MAG: S66 peptidase family protein [Candidatus Izemoplasmatales bacterium]|jgi:muramoyltetrapeptide carboxypeptidase LdcA involved in peptidoglycan recycling
MNKSKHLKNGDKVAIVSLSSGLLGEPLCNHQLKLGINRIKKLGLVPVFMENTLRGIDYLHEHPKSRANDLKQAFFDDDIKAIICAIGGDETYKLLPYLLDDPTFIEKVKTNPKIFMGFSDTTNNHLMFYKLGMVSFYGLAFLTDFAELDRNMLSYTEECVKQLFKNNNTIEIKSSKTWYLDRVDYSSKSLGTARIQLPEDKGYDIIYGSGPIEGELLGGCIESLYDGYTGDRYPEQKEIYEKYQLMPTINDWKNKIMFIETSEEKPSPQSFKKYLEYFSEQGIFAVINGLMVGKPIDEVYYDEYRQILKQFANKYDLPIIYNVNFGHSYPRAILPYGLKTRIDFTNKQIFIVEALFD